MSKGAIGKVSFEMISFLRNFRVSQRVWALTVFAIFGVIAASFFHNLFITGIIIATMIGFAFFITESVMKPLRRLQDELGSVAKGNYDQLVTDLEHADGIAAMARAVEGLRLNALKNANLQKEAEEARLAQLASEREAIEQKQAEEEAQRMFEEKRREEAAVDRQNFQNELATSFENEISGVIQSLSGAVAELQMASETMSDAVDQTGLEVVSAASATDQTGSNMIAVTEATEGLTGAIGEIRTQVEQANTITTTALTTANEARDRVNSLEGASSRIAEVVHLINDIAEQTNLLALNATIEAARAGEAGKGFAVVASEVKNLANQTANATQEIEEQVQAMQQATNETVTAVNSIGKTIDQVSEISSMIAAAVVEQEASTGEIGRSVQNASEGTSNLGQSIGQVQQMADRTKGAASVVGKSSDSLTEQTSFLEESVYRFLGRMRGQAQA
jgi:methyl-accepting chemotaxis protein